MTINVTSDNGDIMFEVTAEMVKQQLNVVVIGQCRLMIRM